MYTHTHTNMKTQNKFGEGGAGVERMDVIQFWEGKIASFRF